MRSLTPAYLAREETLAIWPSTIGRHKSYVPMGVLHFGLGFYQSDLESLKKSRVAGERQCT
jgi:hypothetical protein